ncbi:MAG: hypothetical protein OEV37_01630 [Candidatus Berkelbacteria bacterium]|nr:hypothetical protein [Candidatus Berkelbacteria bacterium]
MIAQIYLKRKTKLDKPFDYEIPRGMKIKKFSLVEIELGTKKTIGLVWGFKDRSPYNLKKISRVLSAGPALTPNQLKLAHLISDEYLSTLSESIFSFLPKLNIRDLNKIGSEAKHARRQKQEKMLLIAEASQRLLFFCQKMQLGQNLAVFPTIHRVEEASRAIKRLNPKLQVYTWHSKLESYQKAKIWQDLISDKNNIAVIGTRHSLLLPFVSLKSAYIDEPTSFAYQEDQAPYYNAYKVARTLAGIFGADLIIGESSPDILSFVALSKGELKIKETKPALDFEIRDGWENFLKDAQNIKSLKPNSKICVIGPWKNQARLQCSDCKSEITCPNCQNPFFEENSFSCTKCKKNYKKSLCSKCGGANIQKTGFLYSKIINDLKAVFPQALITANPKAFSKSHIAVTSINELDRLDPIFETALIPYFIEMANFPYLNFREKLFQKIWGLSSAGVKKIYLFGESLGQDRFTRQLTTNNWKAFLKEEIEERAKLKLPPFSKSVMLVVKCQTPEICEKISRDVLSKIKITANTYPYGQDARAGKFTQKTLLTFPHKEWQKYKVLLKNTNPDFHFEVDPVEFS